MKRPAFQFYPADWRKDAALQSCSLAAQGLWVNLLCIAHECEPYGHLVVNGKPLSAAQIARLVGLGAAECSKLLAELADAGVTSSTESGSIFSRRMVRDEEIRERRAEGGKAGAEHGIKGAEAGKKGGRPKSGRGVSEPPLEPPPSSSSSSSEVIHPPTPRKRGREVHAFPPGFEAFWSAYPRKTAKDSAAKAYARIKPDERLQARILAALSAQAASEQWTRDGGRFVPHAATWLNGRRWEDDIGAAGNDPFAGAA